MARQRIRAGRLALAKMGKPVTGRRQFVEYGRGHMDRVSRAAVNYLLWRNLARDEIVHHVNHDPCDDRLENYLVVSRQEHNRLHKGYPTALALCPGCWALFALRHTRPAQLYCSERCSGHAIPRGFDRGMTRPKFTQADHRRWAEASFRWFVAGADSPPPRLRYWLTPDLPPP